MTFTKTDCQVKRENGNTVVAGKKDRWDLYVIDENKTHNYHITKVEENELWHRRLGHLNQKNMRWLVNCKAIRDILDIRRDREHVCSACLHEKYTRFHYKVKEYSSETALDIVHTDLCGPMRNKGLNGERYFILFVDDFTRRTCIIYLKCKTEALEYFKKYRRMAENDCGRRIKVLRSD